ncbi:MAG: class A beta-lactamase-related serine hydrolase [Fusobacteriaceae bacterium]|jgi:beta-lactamase class A|nr:class A beta-lactamase-related serine hydrolase [Fusobacteriaceae bacterium]
MEQLKEDILKILKKYSGIKGFILRDAGGILMKVNEDEVFPAASIIKLYILGALQNEDFSTRIKLKKEDKVGGFGILQYLNDGLFLSVKDAAVFMIALSDNTATNILIDFIGLGEINRYIQKINAKGTVLGRKMMDLQAKQAGLENYTTPGDTLEILDILCKDSEKLEILKTQACNNKLPLFFNGAIPFAHKTGDLDGIEHDAGRMFFKDRWVDVLVFTKELETKEDGIRINSEIGKLVFTAFQNLGKQE